MFIDTAAANKGAGPSITVQPGSGGGEAETTPLLENFVGQEAPPSYLEATTPGLYARPSGDEEARLLSFDGRPGAGLGSPTPSYKEVGYRRRGLREQCTRRRMLKWMAIILAIILLIVIIAAATPKTKQSNVSPIPVPAQPVESLPAKPGVPSAPKQTFPIRWPSRCGKNYNTNSEEYSFGTPQELNIQESIHQLDGPYKRVSGWIHVAQAPDDQPAGTIQAKFAYAVSSSVDVNSIKYSLNPTGLVVGDPSFPDGFDGIRKGRACLGVSIVLYVAKGAKLENLKIQSTHLGMQVHEGVNFSVTNQTSISLTTGTLDSVSFNSRETRLETISGSISGKYSLFDLLSIRTKSGSVNVNIEPKEAAEDGTEAAIFIANSQSGSIRADFERKRIPDRDYQVTIDTNVGSVDGTFIHGSKTTITSVAGFVTADILPFKSGDYESTLETETSSGQTNLRLRSPYKAAGSVMNKFTSRHKSVSGAIDLTYPQEWEGHLEGTSMNGSLHLQGKDLELIRQDEKPGKNMVEAKKGTGSSSMAFKTVSGGCEVKVGKL
ncbi:hypothetical protein BS50DRAFT_492532 [Corynespora cassiicola Philippines]|uniref:Adhesin domain-containing protein n=1 Tax=Corynespora cassiicola Philippines TaxID=1448308 RepID=A0A2T2NSB0_CORCC|nr:hypothetical protein BS50DRAFT_492532 [Corynespora cassiicola Philippines]